MDTRSLIINFYPRVTTRHEYNYLITLTRVPTWHYYCSNSDPGRAGIASQTRYTTHLNNLLSTKKAIDAYEVFTLKSK